MPLAVFLTSGRPPFNHHAFLRLLSATSEVCFASSRSPLYRDARRRLFPAAPKSGMARSYRTWSSEQLRRMNENHSKLDGIVGQLLPFEGAGIHVAHEIVEGGNVMDDVNWKRIVQNDLLAKELVDLHAELRDALAEGGNSGAAQGKNRRIEHLGNGVYVQYNKYGLDRDAAKVSPATITREESRSVVHHALDALRSEFAVCVTGHPGIGKTRGSMMYAIQCLLHRKAAVLYVGYKSDKMLLFLPGDGGTYQVWRALSGDFTRTRLKLDPRIVAVIDPPEEGSYSSMGECRVLKFVSNNAENHFRNWKKDGVLLVTSMPSREEVVAMTKVLWNDETSPHPWQRGELNTEKKKEAEVKKRIELVGPIPRLVFDSDFFRDAIIECLNGAAEVGEELTDTALYKALRGKYSPFIEKHTASASSRLLFLNPESRHHKTWKDRKMNRIIFQLTPIATHILYERLIRRIEALRKENFEEFAFDWLCATTCRKPEIQPRTGRHLEEEGYRRIISLRACEMLVFRPASKTFPLIDYVVSMTKWFNAKSVGAEATTVSIRREGALEFLTKMKEEMLKAHNPEDIRDILKRDPPVLKLLTNKEVSEKATKEMNLSLFDVAVRIEIINLNDAPAIQLLHGIDRTRMLLEELNEEV